jgi:hypothetical protein
MGVADAGGAANPARVKAALWIGRTGAFIES